MKYKNPIITNLIIFLLITVLPMSLFACGGSEPETESEPASSEAESSPLSEEISFVDEHMSVEQAVGLVERDRLITEMFICNSLCDSSVKEATVQVLSEEHEYASFSAIESLLDSTYLPSGGEKEFFLAYPNSENPSVCDNLGVTNVFNHAGSVYTDFIDVSTVAVPKNDSETEKVITAKTVSGKDVQLKAVKSGNVWLLEKGIYRTNVIENKPFDKKLSFSGSGSLSEFKGNILVIELYLSDRYSEFTQEEEETYHQNIKSAVDYIVSSAESYGTTVSVTYESAYYDYSGVLENNVIGFDTVFGTTGFGTLKAFAEENYELSNYDNYFFVVCYDKEINNEYNACNNQPETELYRAERAFFGNTSTSSELCVSLLSMLGAYNYSNKECDEYLESLYHVYFPNDIMILSDIEQSEMSPVTAYVCGIVSELDPFYRVFIY